MDMDVPINPADKDECNDGSVTESLDSDRDSVQVAEVTTTETGNVYEDDSEAGTLENEEKANSQNTSTT